MMNLYEVARFLEAHDNYDILTHAYPDGDTLGSGFCTLPCAPPNRQKSKSYHNRCSVKVYLSLSNTTTCGTSLPNSSILALIP